VVKVESNMLVLDATFSKQDAEAINYFVEIARTAERERIIKLLEEMPDNMFSGGSPLEEAAGAAIRLAIRRINGSLGEMRKIK
jgi:hypothetical protein